MGVTDEGYWTKEDVYDTQISPLMAQIIAICKEHDIPVVAQFQYCNTAEDGPGFVTTAMVKEPRSAASIIKMGLMARPQPAVALAITEVTQPDGTKRTTIRRV
jgi:hypothetical protein